jgi:hypothetical protein
MTETTENNTEQERPAITDLLVNMFIKQAQHVSEYNEIYRKRGHIAIDPRDFGNINDPRVQLKIRETAGFLVEELYEAVNLLKNKPWKQTLRDTDPDEFYGELADAWHFWLELMIYSGMMPAEVQRYYFKIAKSNETRRETGY